MVEFRRILSHASASNYSREMIAMRPFLPLVLLAVTVALHAQPAAATFDAGLATALNFEREHKGSTPDGWRGGPSDTLGIDDVGVHGGKWAARIQRTAKSTGQFSSLTNSIPIDFSGRQVEFRGFIRTQDVTGYAGLWLREDGSGAQLEFANMQRRQLNGTTDWAEYTLTLPLNSAARTLVFGYLVSGTGTAWADDFQIRVDGQPVWQAPKVERDESILERDKEFDGNSKIALTALTPLQVENLALLGEVWGFFKYHHPAVTSGQYHWDYELFRIAPAILAANDRAAARDELRRWIERLGELKPAEPPPVKPDVHLPADRAWFESESGLGSELARSVRAVHAARSSAAAQFYVSHAPNIGNPDFGKELAYPRIRFPDSGYQLLALYRFWNVIRYWFPYRDLITEDWHAVLREFVPRIALAPTRDKVELELMALIARVHDTHANLWSSMRVRPPAGDNQLPIVVRFIEDRPTVTEVLMVGGEPVREFQRGDILLAIGERTVSELISEWSPYYAASNEPTRRRDIARSITRGPAGVVKLRVLRGETALDLEAPRIPTSSLTSQIRNTHDLPGPAFRRLSPDVAYLKLSTVKADEVANYLEQAAGTKGWVIDIRNYPSAFMVFALGAHLVSQPTDFASFTLGSSVEPGSFSFRKGNTLQPKSPHYAGKLVILVDEVSQSQAEYTAMAFRAAPGAVVVGSTTAGADGNVSRIMLPGGLSSMISGVGVFYADRRPTQRIGIIPDIEVKPTLAGTKSGRDEVLEVALRQILGPQVAAEEIQKLSKPAE
jgi:C-terminal processing protease CtpA/Prc